MEGNQEGADGSQCREILVCVNIMVYELFSFPCSGLEGVVESGRALTSFIYAGCLVPGVCAIPTDEC